MTKIQSIRNLSNRVLALGPMLRQTERELGDSTLEEMTLGELRICPNAYLMRWLLKSMMDQEVPQKAAKELVSSLAEQVKVDIDKIDQEYAKIINFVGSLQYRIKEMRKSTKARLLKMHETQEEPSTRKEVDGE